MIEPECLAIVWATAKSRVFLAGAEFEITTEDKPLSGTNPQQIKPRSNREPQTSQIGKEAASTPIDCPMA